MFDKNPSKTEPDLKGYKEEILPVNKARIRLERDLYFVGATQRGAQHAQSVESYFFH